MLSQVGVMESGGNNKGERIKEYLSSVGLPEGYPWCSAIVHWSYRRCGDVKEPARRFAMALEWHPENRRIWEKGTWARDDDARISRDSDHFALYYGNLGRIGHTGLIYGEDEDYVLTIEGNTSGGGSRDGDGVYLRKRLKSSLHCVSRW